MNTKIIDIPREIEGRIDVSRINPNTEGIILVKSKEGDCTGYICYDGREEEWVFCNEIDNYTGLYNDSELLNVMNDIINSKYGDSFELLEF